MPGSKQKLKGLLIIGPDSSSEVQNLYDKPGYLAIGDGKNLISEEEIIKALEAHGGIDSNTRIDLGAHGDIVSGSHVVKLIEDSGPSRTILNLLQRMAGKDVPLEVHFWSCYGGAAAKDVSALSPGSVVIAHAPPDESILLEPALMALSESVERQRSKDYKRSLPGEKEFLKHRLPLFEDLAQELPFASAQTLNIGVRLKDKDIRLGAVEAQAENYTRQYTIEPKDLSYIFREGKSLDESAESIDGLDRYFSEAMSTIYDDLKSLEDTGYLPDNLILSKNLCTVKFSAEERKYYLSIYAQYLAFTKNPNLLKALKESPKLAKDLSSDPKVLYTACYIGNTKLARVILEVPGVDVNQHDKFGNTPLHAAISQRHVDIAKQLITVPGIDVNLKDKLGKTPLLAAIEGGQIDIVKQLIAAPGIDVNLKDSSGSTPLHVAISQGHGDIVEQLIAAPGIDVNPKDMLGTTPLHVAIIQGHADIVKQLIAAPGIDVNLKDSSGKTPLFVAISQGHADIVKQLIAAPGIDVNLKDSSGNTPLHYAISQGHADIVEQLIAAPGIDVSLKDGYGYTPLHVAIIQGHADIVKQLIAAPGIDVNLKDSSGKTPLFVAISQGHADIVKQLITVPGIDVNLKNSYENTPLHVAIRQGHADIVKQLIAAPGIDVNLKDSYGNTPLHVAISQGHADIVKQLIAAPGIDVNPKDRFGTTPLHVAISQGHADIVKQLIAAPGIDVNPKDRFGTTPLHVAIRQGHADIVKQLIAAPSIDVNLIDNFGYTALSLAVKDIKNVEIVKILLEHPNIKIGSSFNYEYAIPEIKKVISDYREEQKRKLTKDKLDAPQKKREDMEPPKPRTRELAPPLTLGAKPLHYSVRPILPPRSIGDMPLQRPAEATSSVALPSVDTTIYGAVAMLVMLKTLSKPISSIYQTIRDKFSTYATEEATKSVIDQAIQDVDSLDRTCSEFIKKVRKQKRESKRMDLAKDLQQKLGNFREELEGFLGRKRLPVKMLDEIKKRADLFETAMANLEKLPEIAKKDAESYSPKKERVEQPKFQRGR